MPLLYIYMTDLGKKLGRRRNAAHTKIEFIQNLFKKSTLFPLFFSRDIRYTDKKYF